MASSVACLARTVPRTTSFLASITSILPVFGSTMARYCLSSGSPSLPIGSSSLAVRSTVRCLVECSSSSCDEGGSRRDFLVDAFVFFWYGRKGTFLSRRIPAAEATRHGTVNKLNWDGTGKPAKYGESLPITGGQYLALLIELMWMDVGVALGSIAAFFLGLCFSSPVRFRFLPLSSAMVSDCSYSSLCEWEEVGMVMMNLEYFFFLSIKVPTYDIGRRYSTYLTLKWSVHFSRRPAVGS